MYDWIFILVGHKNIFSFFSVMIYREISLCMMGFSINPSWKNWLKSRKFIQNIKNLRNENSRYTTHEHSPPSIVNSFYFLIFSQHSKIVEFINHSQYTEFFDPSSRKICSKSWIGKVTRLSWIFEDDFPRIGSNFKESLFW